MQGYNIEFKYQGVSYTLLGWMDGDCIALLDAKGNEIQRFSDPLDAIQHCVIGGNKLLGILAEITDMECL